jgi:hypothetical protein
MSQIGVVVSYFPNGYGFVRVVGPVCNPGCDHHQSRSDCNRPSYFYHIKRSPNLNADEVFVGMMVDFEIDVSSWTGRKEAVNLNRDI